MEKVGDSQLSSEPVSSTSKEMTKGRQRVVLEVEISLEKIKGVLEKLRETGDIYEWLEVTDGTVRVFGYNLDPDKLRMELENEAGIKSITDPTNIIRSVIVTELSDSDYKEVYFQSGKIPEMPILESGDRRTEILYHGEKPMEYSNNRRRRWWSSDRVPYSGKIPNMSVLEYDDWHTDILYHGEKPMEYSSNRRRQWWSSGVMVNNREMGDAGGSESPEIPTAEVFYNHRTQFQSNASKCSIL